MSDIPDSQAVFEKPGGTSISFLSFNDDDDDYGSSNFDPIEPRTDDVEIDNLAFMLADCTLSLKTRTSIIDDVNTTNPLKLMDVISELCASYTENETSSLAKCLAEIAEMSFLPLPLKLRCAMTIDDSHLICEVVKVSLRLSHKTSLFRQDLDLGERSENRCEDINHTLCFTACSSCLQDVPNESIPILTAILSKSTLETSYRYKLLLHVIENPDPIGKVECIRAVLTSVTVPKYVVYAAQLAQRFQCLTLDDCKMCLSFTNFEDKAKSDLAAAEICDFLLTCKEGEPIYDIVKARLMSIEGVDVIQLFKSNQTVHQVSSDVEGFVKDLLQYEPATFATVVLHLRGMPNFTDAVDIALNRFSLDAGLYSSMACSLSNILCRVYAKIQLHSEKALLMERLVEECADMSDTCSSGHLVRLINVFSGIDGGITLSIKDEINSVMQHRISKLISCQPPDIQEAIVEELTMEKQDAIQKYLYKEMAILHDIMKTEYKGLLSDSSFTEYFRNAILFYTCPQ